MQQAAMKIASTNKMRTWAKRRLEWVGLVKNKTKKSYLYTVPTKKIIIQNVKGMIFELEISPLSPGFLGGDNYPV